jgi:hypothetical protein
MILNDKRNCLKVRILLHRGSIVNEIEYMIAIMRDYLIVIVSWIHCLALYAAQHYTYLRL